MNDWKRIPKKQPVMVDWVDAWSSNKWAKIGDIDESPLCCRSMGYIIKRGKDSLVLAASMSESGNASEHIVIPRSCVKAIRKVIVEE